MDRPTSAKADGTRAPKLSHALVQFFRAQIASGELKPGDTLPSEAELLQQLRVSRATLRQALRVLESESLIRLGKGARTGARVLHPSIETAAQYGALYLATHGTTLGEIHHVRTLLEPPLAALVAGQANKEAVKSLQECVRTQQEALQRGDYIAAATAVNNFHERLERFSQNRALGLVAGMLNSIAVNVYPQIPIATRNARQRNLIWRRSEKSTEAHAHVVALIASGKADAAERFWREYMLDTADFMHKSGLATIRVRPRESQLGTANVGSAARNLRTLRLRSRT